MDVATQTDPEQQAWTTLSSLQNEQAKITQEIIRLHEDKLKRIKVKYNEFAFRAQSAEKKNENLEQLKNTLDSQVLALNNEVSLLKEKFQKQLENNKIMEQSFRSSESKVSNLIQENQTLKKNLEKLTEKTKLIEIQNNAQLDF